MLTNVETLFDLYRQKGPPCPNALAMGQDAHIACKLDYICSLKKEELYKQFIYQFYELFQLFNLRCSICIQFIFLARCANMCMYSIPMDKNTVMSAAFRVDVVFGAYC